MGVGRAQGGISVQGRVGVENAPVSPFGGPQYPRTLGGLVGFIVDRNLEGCPPLLTFSGPQWIVRLSLSKRGSGVCSQHLNTGTLLLVL